MTACLERKVEAMIKRCAARQAPGSGADGQAVAAKRLPLIRLRVDYTGFRCAHVSFSKHCMCLSLSLSLFKQCITCAICWAYHGRMIMFPAWLHQMGPIVASQASLQNVFEEYANVRPDVGRCAAAP